MAALFPLGLVFAALVALGLLEEHGTDPGELLGRHQGGDWGDLGPEDRKMNDRDLRECGRLFSAYDTSADRLWIIQADRSSTTILIPEDY